MAVVRFLVNRDSDVQIIAGVRNMEKAKKALKDFPGIGYRYFDLEKPNTLALALEGIDTLFLVRPPSISNISRYFEPLIDSLKINNIKKVVFLSVQGADSSKVIPHYKIENLLVENGFDYIFLRPGYFMQNLTTTLHQDIIHRRKIILPAGKARFNWIDVENIGEIGAILITRFEEFKRQAFDITGQENLNFHDVTAIMNEYLPVCIEYVPANPVKFYWIKKKEKMPAGMIMVMILLHFLPRFLKEPRISNFYEEITGKKPTPVSSFIQREKHMFIP